MLIPPVAKVAAAPPIQDGRRRQQKRQIAPGKRLTEVRDHPRVRVPYHAHVGKQAVIGGGAEAHHRRRKKHAHQPQKAQNQSCGQWDELVFEPQGQYLKQQRQKQADKELSAQIAQHIARGQGIGETFP